MSTAELCPLVWTADRRAVMDGWSEPERDDKGPVRWTISQDGAFEFAGASLQGAYDCTWLQRMPFRTGTSKT